jgi:hypothetical protein
MTLKQATMALRFGNRLQMVTFKELVEADTLAVVVEPVSDL